MDCSPLGFSIHGVFQARILEWVVISYSRGSSQPRNWTCISYLLDWQVISLPLVPPGKPREISLVSLYKGATYVFTLPSYILNIFPTILQKALIHLFIDILSDSKSRIRLSDWTELNWTEHLYYLSLRKVCNCHYFNMAHHCETASKEKGLHSHFELFPKTVYW